MDFLKNLFSNPIHIGLGSSTVISAVDFFTHLTTYLSDGKLDMNEIASLLSSLGGIQLVILVLVLKAVMGKKEPPAIP